MIELRWKLEPPMPNKGREDRWTLQYRFRIPDLDYTGLPLGRIKWCDWIDVPYFSPQ